MSTPRPWEAIAWLPIDEVARNGRSQLLRNGDDLALGRFDGERFVFPATGGMPLPFVPTCYHPVGCS